MLATLYHAVIFFTSPLGGYVPYPFFINTALFSIPVSAAPPSPGHE